VWRPTEPFAFFCPSGQPKIRCYARNGVFCANGRRDPNSRSAFLLSRLAVTQRSLTRPRRVLR